jgi:putative hydrolase of the HAD superfamily
MPMINNIIFDFGDVFIDLDKQIVFREMQKKGGEGLTPMLIALNNAYEIGDISSEEFIDRLKTSYPNATANEIIEIWNSMLLDFPEYRLEFIENLARENRYRLFLLSNTNALHIPHVETKMGFKRFNRFKDSFEKFYLSHEIGLRKPDREIFQFVLDDNGLIAEETLFIDDSKENTDAASALGLQCWNLRVGQEDIIELKSKL